MSRVSMGEEGLNPCFVMTTTNLLVCYRLRDDDGCAYDQMSTSIIRLNNGTILYLREVNRFVLLGKA